MSPIHNLLKIFDQGMKVRVMHLTCKTLNRPVGDQIFDQPPTHFSQRNMKEPKIITNLDL
jgi:hypothetical protein